MRMDQLPVEILVHLLSFLPTADLIHVSWVNKRLSDVACDPQLLRHLDLRQAYMCCQNDLKAFLCSKGRSSVVQTLDMDAVYWLRPPLDIIVRMKNLHALHLRGIPLTLRQLHRLLTAGLLLQELSIDWPQCSEQPKAIIEEMREGVSRLKFLCLMVLTLRYCGVNHFLRLCQAPLRLVLYCRDLNSLFYPPRCDIIFAYQPSAQHLLNTDAITWRSTGDGWIKEQDKQQKQQLTPLSQVTEIAAYDIVDGCSAGAAVAVMQACPNLKTLQLQIDSELAGDLQYICKAFPKLQGLRLNMNHSKKLKRKDCILSVSTLHNLTHLSLEVHLLSEVCGSNKTSATMPATLRRDVRTIQLKRPRLGVTSCQGDAEAGILNLIIDNCPLLTMLEIGADDGVHIASSYRPVTEGSMCWHSLKNIKKLKGLTHLTLCHIPVTDGSFLSEIAAGCQGLEFLRLASLGPDGKCCYMKELTDSLPHMANLTHLRIHQQYLAPGTALFSALKKCSRLQRLSITSDRDMLPVDLPALEQLIKSQPSLIFVGVGSISTPKTACTMFTRKLKKISRPALVVVVYSKTEERPTVPSAHQNMLELTSWLSGSHSYSSYLQVLSSRHHALQLRGFNTLEVRDLCW